MLRSRSTTLLFLAGWRRHYIASIFESQYFVTLGQDVSSHRFQVIEALVKDFSDRLHGLRVAGARHRLHGSARLVHHTLLATGGQCQTRSPAMAQIGSPDFSAGQMADISLEVHFGRAMVVHVDQFVGQDFPNFLWRGATVGANKDLVQRLVESSVKFIGAWLAHQVPAKVDLAALGLQSVQHQSDEKAAFNGLGNVPFTFVPCCSFHCRRRRVILGTGGHFRPWAA